METSRDVAEAYWELTPDLSAAGMARALARKTLAAWGLSAIADEVMMAVSELVTNATVHAEPPIILGLYRQGTTARGEVTDRGKAWPSIRDAGPDDEHGRGLSIVAAYCDRWGVDPEPNGKTVWFVCSPGSQDEKTPSLPQSVTDGLARLEPQARNKGSKGSGLPRER